MMQPLAELLPNGADAALVVLLKSAVLILSAALWLLCAVWWFAPSLRGHEAQIGPLARHGRPDPYAHAFGDRSTCDSGEIALPPDADGGRQVPSSPAPISFLGDLR